MMQRRLFIRYVLGSLAAGLSLDAALNAASAQEKVARKAPPVPRDKPAQRPTPKPVAPAVLVLDPGHGGRDPGAIGVSGTHEKDITLSICLQIRDILKSRRDIKVVLTRDNDEYLTLPSRVSVAHKHNADLFISIHADAAPNRSARGLSAYSRSDRASDSFASTLAERENRVDGVYGLDLRGTDKETAAILLDLARRHNHNASLGAKRRIVNGIGNRVQLLDNPMRSANFAVLRSPRIPSVLIETGFLTNPQDERILRDAKSRALLARHLADQIAPVTLDLREA
ncbi:N-acetylmuramoyl-L-alanine amidase [Ferrovibrio sp.]|uniref:N-acetylmuramoyl-L-alanine amidase family protein n=1 Tax=Ferrovibrio sp. TaxID=1917215 RepID=UPI0025B8D8D4|nr:N-acetylmuramoyl-L-alanine amidase [Ferrovibrio sp.]MBX3456379.1 N-acetylmuramoyl-L-alanine amidase [Ferrovibrio sp.]